MNRTVRSILPFVFGIAAVVHSLPAKSAETYCPVEVGSKGIKGRIFELEVGKECMLMPREIYSRNENLDLVDSITNGQFTDAAIDSAAVAVARFINAMQSQAPSCKPFVVGSSGVAKAKNLDALADAVAEKTKLPKMGFIDAKQEAEYGYYSSVSGRERTKSLVIDIGSGNTKFGYIDGKRQFVGAELAYGSVTLNKLVGISDLPPRFSLARVAMNEVLPAFRTVVKEHPEILNRSNTIWIGGAAWATAMYSHPEAADKPSVTVTRSDIEEFLIALEKDNWKDRKPPKPLTVAQAKAWEKQWADVTSVFKNTGQLLSGVFLMKVILSDGIPRQSVHFPLNGQWISGYTAALYKLESGHDACNR
jgi:hypothetical protein